MPRRARDRDRLLTEACTAAGLTVSELAHVVGVSAQALHRIRSGRRPLVTTALRIAQALDVEVEELFGRSHVA